MSHNKQTLCPQCSNCDGTCPYDDAIMCLKRGRVYEMKYQCPDFKERITIIAYSDDLSSIDNGIKQLNNLKNKYYGNND